MPGRKYSAGSGYRYGFNGKENDKEVKGDGNQQDYGMRIYDPRLGKFLSVDPLSNSFPMLTPYQYASNRPIDGIDMDGLEYLTYTMVVDYETGNVLQKKVEWFNPKQHNAHGKIGQGVQYKISVYDQKHQLNRDFNYSFVFRNDNKSLYGYHVYTEYGNYMGSTSLYTVGKGGKFTSTYDYDLDAVDAVDNFAKNHDKAYDNLNAKGADGLFDDWGTTPADEIALKGWTEFRDKYKVGDVDPYNNQKVTEDERDAARNGKMLFNYVVNKKKAAITGFMINNYGNTIPHPGNGVDAREYYYKQFLDMYMKRDANGNWTRNKDMWTRDSKGVWKPNKPKK